MDCVDLQPSHGAAALLVQVFQRAGDLIDRRPQPLEQAMAGVGHRHAARRTVQQAHPETLLQLPHRVAERRGRDTEPQCGCTKAEMIGDRDERGQVGQVATIHC